LVVGCFQEIAMGTFIGFGRSRIRLAERGAMSVAAVFMSLGAAAQSLPSPDGPPIRFEVPFGVGANADVVARTVAQKLSAIIQRPVIVENKAGAGGNIASEYVANALPDGKTLLFTVNNVITVNPHLYKKLQKNPMTDLTPVAMVYASGGYLLVASVKSGYKSVAEVIAAAKEKPGALNFASYGIGTMPHMCGELLQSAAGIKLSHVPYKTGSLIDVIGGQIELAFEPTGPALEHIRAGKLTALAITGPARISVLPNVPTMAETLPGYSCGGWVGILAPARTPPDIVNGLSAEILKVAREPEFSKQRESEGGRLPTAGTPQEFGKIMKEDYDLWGKIIGNLNVDLD
jgi:tripartite-type tricarboxylate transporter receptor subunit TctC